VYKAIVVGTDGSETAERAVREAADLARAFSAPLHLVSAYRTSTPMASMAMVEVGGASMFGDWIFDQRTDVEQQLEAVSRQLEEAGVNCEVHCLPGNPVEAILKVAEERHADLIVVGNKGMNGARRVLGSVPNSVAHKASCTVLVVKTC
jgi:nucleotide-binding universal stress UspA family protein